MAASVDERRRYQEQAAAWPNRLWLSEAQFLPGRAVDLSLHGPKVLVQSLPAGIVPAGRACHPQICLETSDEFSCVAMVRRVNGYELGLETREELPASLFRSDSLRLRLVPGFARS